MAGITRKKTGREVPIQDQQQSVVDAGKSKKILILQGPVGPFFSELCDSLRNQGCLVDYYSLNYADHILADGRTSLVCQSLKDFESSIQEKIQNDYDAVVLFGSNRPAHQIARKHGRKAKKTVFCFEEGYIRPGFVTLELGGNNASSPLRSIPSKRVCQRSTTRMHAVDYRGYWPMVLYGARYYILRQLTSLLSDTCFNHRNTPLLSEGFYWSRGLIRKAIFGPKHNRLARDLISSHSGRYYIVSLQVKDDSNVVIHSNGWDSERLIKETLVSFANYAPPKTKLVFKIHPMARGHSCEQKLINKIANNLSVSDRTVVLHDGSLGELTKHSSGMITINSTSGLSAIHHGVPLLSFGDSIYTNDFLNSKRKEHCDLDRFWWHREVVNPELRKGFLAYLRKQSLIPGDFYAPRGRRTAVRSATRKIVDTLNKSSTL